MIVSGAAMQGNPAIIQFSDGLLLLKLEYTIMVMLCYTIYSDKVL